MTSNGVLLNADETLNLWLNGAGEYHGDKNKRAELARLQEPLESDALRPLFISMLIDKAKAVTAIAEIVKLLARRGEKGTEVGFGGLNIGADRLRRSQRSAD